MPKPPPRLLLVGAGRFGAQHLLELERLRAEGRVTLAGVVVASAPGAEALRARLDVPVHVGLDDHALDDVDAVDIVTPPSTHVALVERCLERAHVLVEKPLATSADEAWRLAQRARALGHVLVAGHVYRYHPVVRALAEVLAALGERPAAVGARMINPADDRAGRGPIELEFLHLFDILDLLLGAEPRVCRSVTRGDDGLVQASLLYPGPVHAVLEMGWSGRRRVRTLRFEFDDRRVDCDLADGQIVTTLHDHQCEKVLVGQPVQALRAELADFLSAADTGSAPTAGAEIGARIVAIAERARPRPPPARPRVLVVGGGMFGAVTAIELGRHFEVTLAERRGALLTEASFANQWRHHAGFHYPRSFDQIDEIKAARRDFEEEYGAAVLRAFPAYFCTAASATEIPAEAYRAACAANGLSFRVAEPPRGVVDRDMVSLCLEVDEGVYDFARLAGMVDERLAANPRVRVRLGTEVVDATLDDDGGKRVTLRCADGTILHERFDYLVNATYANRNLVARWFGFPAVPLRFDFCELLLVRLPIDPVCVSIVDGPFMSLVSTGAEREFILSHAIDSLHYSVIPPDGLPPPPRPWRSSREMIVRHARAYFPVLDQIEIVESRFAYRAVPAYSPDLDARPTVVTDHGFGCWSVLGGKIITCVSNAREIAAGILAERVPD